MSDPKKPPSISLEETIAMFKKGHDAEAEAFEQAPKRFKEGEGIDETIPLKKGDDF